MLENLKWYMVKIGLKKYVPMGVMAALTWLGTYMAAHAGMLEQWGVTYGTWPLTWPAGQQPSGDVMLIEFGTLSKAAIAGIAAVAGIVIRASQHHTTGEVGIPGGERKEEDPPIDTKGDLN